MNAPLAYLLTWTCHGTWLHGDRRGSVDDAHNLHGRPMLDPNERRWARERVMVGPAVVKLSDPMREIVDRAIRDHGEFRGWTLHELNVRTNHVHVVVGGLHEPEEMMGQFKAWATRRLRESGLMPSGRKIWTNQGSNRYLWDAESVAAAVRYVREQ